MLVGLTADRLADKIRTGRCAKISNEGVDQGVALSAYYVTQTAACDLFYNHVTQCFWVYYITS